MALFGKKSLTLDEILKGIDGLSNEEKEKVHAKMQDLYKAEDEREIDKIEEDKAEDTETADEKAEEVKDESEEIGKDVDEVEEEVEDDETGEATEEQATEETSEDDGVETTTEELAEENEHEVIKQLTDRVGELEAKIKDLLELKSEMEAFTEKQRKAYGYEGRVPGGKKDYKDMTADELKKEILGL